MLLIHFGANRGYNIGIRLIDEYLSKSKTTKCVDFHDTAEKIAKVGSHADYKVSVAGRMQSRIAHLSSSFFALQHAGWTEDVLEYNSHRDKLEQHKYRM